MKKIYTLFVITICVTKAGLAQGLDFEWARVGGKFAYDYGYGISTDNFGNVYIAGKYEENAVFSGVTLPNEGNHDIYVAQYSPSGNLNWIRTAGGFNGDYARCITTNKTDKIFIAGEVEDGNASVFFHGSSTVLYPKGNNDLFIACYDLSGTLQWAMRDGDVDNEKANGITLDPSNNIVVCGHFDDTTKFGGTTSAISKGDHDMLVAKYDANGNFLWMKNAGGPGLDDAKAVVCDRSGNIYIAGVMADSAVFGSTTYTVANTPYGKFSDGFVAKYDTDGNLIWVKVIGAEYTDAAWSIAIDTTDKLYVTGEFTSGQFTGSGTTWSYGKEDMFVACYDTDGNCQWVNHAGGDVTDRGRGIAVDGNTILVTGQVGLVANFGSVSVTAADSEDVFVAGYDNAGNFLWVRSVGGTPDSLELAGYESGNAICGNSGVAYATGALLNDGVFLHDSLRCYSRTDVFLAKLSMTSGSSFGIEQAKDANVSVYPNPATDKLHVKHAIAWTGGVVTLVDAVGRSVYSRPITAEQTTIDVSDYARGIYTMQVTTGLEVTFRKIIIE